MASRDAVRFDCSPATAFAYLSDPRNRPQWQSSLRSVEILSDPPDGPDAVWRDVTAVGLRPTMRTVVWEPGRRWAEDGVWHGITAHLELMLEPDGDATLVRTRFRLRGAGLFAPIARAAGFVAPPFVRADLRRAAERCRRLT